MFKLETQRLILRDMKISDETDFVAISQDVKYQRFYDESDCDPDKYRQLTRLFIEQAQEDPRTSYQLAIEHKPTGTFIGTVCLRIEKDNQASIGAGLSREFQGSGYIQEATKALTEHGFSKLGIHRIYAETISENKATIKLCQSLGMRKEAHFKEQRYFKGRWWDSVVLAILKSEWLKRNVS
ncbi:GNAT family N-acetyltransferase [Psychromonas sp. KJ10-10]|uniref:GNAT family N-acetyltransferase n=1 Tax=Psychromonas sp. KJ10-10 TaxID=3391823 RepID=UPI0039B48975